MTRSHQDASRWRGWVASGTGEEIVTSAPLGAGAEVSNRLFPKTRSWFALGAPLELLSPLSVLRIIFALGIVWMGVGLCLASGEVPTIKISALLAITAGTWVALLKIRQVGSRSCQVLVGLAALTSVAAAAASRDQGLVPAIYFASFLFPTGVNAGLFLSSRALLSTFTAAATGLAVVLIAPFGWGQSIAVAAPLALSLLVVCGTVKFLAGSARRKSTIDPDTGLPNGFGLAEIVARRGSEYSTFLVAVTQLAGVEQARDALGHRIGSELLRRAVEDLGQVLPTSAVIGRVDGDRLVVLFPLPASRLRQAGQPSVTLPEGPEALSDATGSAAELAGTLAKAIQAGRYLVGDIEIFLRAHVGVALAPWDSTDVIELERQASLTSRQAEAAGVPFRLWTGSAEAMTADDLSLLADLRLASGRGELWLAYQPQISVLTEAPVAVEALLRWTHSSRGPISPATFIPLAERTGLIDSLTEWVLSTVLDAQVRWLSVGVEIPVSVNFSAKTVTRPDLAEWVTEELSVRRLPASVLTVEVTETAECADLVEAVALLRPLQQMGVRISIDDFGTGYTSLAVLPQLPLDELKVDQRFVLSMLQSPADEAIVRSVRDLAGRLGLDAVAEGVEDSTTAAKLVSFGFDLLQGYHFARPMDEQRLLEYLREVSRPSREPSGHSDNGQTPLSQRPGRSEGLMNAERGTRQPDGIGESHIERKMHELAEATSLVVTETVA